MWWMMQGSGAIRTLLTRAGLTPWTVSKRMGRAGQYLDATMRAGRTPRADTLAEIADACGADLVLVDRETGETIGRIDPPKRED